MDRTWVAGLLIMCAVLSGCSIQRAGEAKRAKVELVGMSQERILSCMGVPVAEKTLGQTTVWQYFSGGDSRAVVTAQQLGQTTIATLNRKRRYCEVNLVMRSGVVEAVNYSGRTGGLVTQGEQCAFAVQNCLN